MRLVETLTTTGPALALEPALDDEDDGRIRAERDAVLVDDDEPIGVRVLGEADVRARATHEIAQPGQARLVRLRVLRGCCVRARVDGDHVAAEGLEQAKRGSRRGAAAGIHGDLEPARPDALDVDGPRDRAEVPGGGRRVGANLGHVQGAHPGIDALVIEVGELGRLVGPKGQSLGADEPERVPLERAVASADRDAAEGAGLAHVEHQRGDGDDSRRRPGCTRR